MMPIIYIFIGAMIAFVIVLMILMAINTKKDLDKLKQLSHNTNIDYNSPLLTRECGMNKE